MVSYREDRIAVLYLSDFVFMIVQVQKKGDKVGVNLLEKLFF